MSATKSEAKAAGPAADAPKPKRGLKKNEGSHVFGVCHIYASFNDTFVVRPHNTYAAARHRLALDTDLRCSPVCPVRWSPQHVTDLSGKETICKITGACEADCIARGVWRVVLPIKAVR
jgi:hypothetical protein